MVIDVADVRGNLNETILHAVKIIGRSKARRDVFEEIYRGKKKEKSVSDLMKATGLDRVRVLQEGRKLAANGVVEQVRVDGETAYKKYDAYSQHKRAVLDLVAHPEKKDRYPTKQEPRIAGSAVTHRFVVPRSAPQPQEVTIDGIEAFSEVRKWTAGSANLDLSRVPEEQIKRFLVRVIGEPNEFRDWGGEKNDIYTTRLRFRNARRTAAFAIKGRATSGTLTPRKMGANGDQVIRLLASEAEIFFVAYHGKVDQAIHEQLRAHGLGRAMSGKRVYYCVIDGTDLGRLATAYAAEFAAASR